MAKIFSTIVFTGKETPQEIALKMADFQRESATRIAALEKLTEELQNRIEDLEE